MKRAIILLFFVLFILACGGTSALDNTSAVTAPTSTPIQSVWSGNAYCDAGAVGLFENYLQGGAYLYPGDSFGDYWIPKSAAWTPCDASAVLELTWRGQGGELIRQRLKGPMPEKIEKGLYVSITASKE